MEGKKLLNRDRIVAIVWMLIAAYVWYEPTKYPVSLLDAVGPSKYPHLLAALLGVGAVALFITSNKETEEKGVQDYKSMFYVIGCVLVYLLLFNPLGFVLSTIIFLMSMCMYFDDRDRATKLKGAIPYSVGFSIVLYIFFAKVLGVQLPTLFL